MAASLSLGPLSHGDWHHQEHSRLPNSYLPNMVSASQMLLVAGAGCKNYNALVLQLYSASYGRLSSCFPYLSGCITDRTSQA